MPTPDTDAPADGSSGIGLPAGSGRPQGAWRGRRRRRLDERGSTSLLAVIAAVGMIVAVGLAADLGGAVYARQHATQVAGQATRSAAQQLTPADAIRGVRIDTQPARARAAASSWLTSAGLTGTVRVSGTTVTVTAADSYQTRFLGIIGVDTLHVSATATAHAIRALDGTPR